MNTPPPISPSEELLVAGDAFRKTLIPRADWMREGYYPMWHGWALMDAFIAGANFASGVTPASADLPRNTDGMRAAMACEYSACVGHDLTKARCDHCPIDAVASSERAQEPVAWLPSGIDLTLMQDKSKVHTVTAYNMPATKRDVPVYLAPASATSPTNALARIQPDVTKIQDGEARAVLGEIMAYVTTDQRIRDLIEKRIAGRSEGRDA